MPIINLAYWVNWWWGGWGWQPWANTIAYWTLDNTLADSSWNGYTLTNAWEWTFVQEISWINRYMLYCNGNWYWTGNPWMWWVYTQSLPNSINDITLNIWAKCLYNSGAYYARWMFDTHLNSSSNWVRQETYWGNVYAHVWNGSWNVTSVNISNPDTYMPKWSLWTITYSRTTKVLQIYMDGVLNSSGVSSYNPSNNWLSYFTLWIWFATNQSGQYRRTFYGYIWATVLEDKVRTAQEISDYYNQTKWDYWIS